MATVWTAPLTVNTSDNGTGGDDQRDPTITLLSNGNFLVSWADESQSNGFNGSGSTIVGRIFDATGTPVTGEIDLVSMFSDGNQDEVSVAADPNGGFVVAFSDVRPGGDTFVRVASFDNSGTSRWTFSGNEAHQTVPVQGIGTSTRDPSVTVLDDGRVIVIAENVDASGDVTLVYHSIADDGLSSTSDFAASAAVSDYIDPNVIVNSDGEVTLFYNAQNRTTPSTIDLQAVLADYDSLTGALSFGGTFVQFDPPGATGRAHDIVALTDGSTGKFVAVWQEGPSESIAAVVYNNDMTAASTYVNRVLGHASVNEEIDPTVAALDDGGFIMFWDDEDNDELIGRVFSASFVGNGGPFLVPDSVVSGAPGSPDAVQLGDGRIALVFEETTAGNSDVRLVFFDAFGNPNIEGTDEADFLVAGAVPTALTGFAANDTLNGAGFNDTLNGGTGADSMVGGAGDDFYTVDDAGDVIVENPGEGIDTVQSFIDYVLPANVEDLLLLGAATNGTGNVLDNRITGTAAANTLVGGNGEDTLDGGAGADSMAGGQSDDVFIVDNVGDQVVEASNEGTDTVRSTISFVLGLNVENLTLLGAANLTGTGNGAANVLTGNNGGNVLAGGASDDLLLGEAGNDTLNGGPGADTMNGGANNDVIIVDNAGDQAIGGGGIDRVNASINFSLGADIENLTLTGSGNIRGTGNNLSNTIVGNGGNNTLFGSGGHDSLVGNAGNDTVNGGVGIDTMKGGAGNDLLIVDNVNDQALGGGGNDTVNAAVNFSLAGDVENLTLTGAGNVRGTGNALGNTIIGNGGNNNLFGSNGRDSLLGNAGNDTVNGGAGIDTMKGGAGNDLLIVDNASDQALGGGGTDTVNAAVNFTLANDVENLTLVGSANVNGTGNFFANVIAGNGGRNALSGNGGNDRLTGNNGDDTLNGGANNDTLLGGNGNDLFDGGNGNDDLFGGAGNNDMAAYSGGIGRYQITEISGGRIRVVDSQGTFGTDTLSDIEKLKFGATVFNVADAVNAQPPHGARADEDVMIKATGGVGSSPSRPTPVIEDDLLFGPRAGDTPAVNLAEPSGPTASDTPGYDVPDPLWTLATNVFGEFWL